MAKTIRKVMPGKLQLPKLIKVAAYARVSSGKDAMLHGMNQRQLPFAVERFGYDAGRRADRTKAIIGEVCAVCRIYTNQRIFLLPGMIKTPPS